VLKATSQIPIGFGIQEDDAKEFRTDLVYPRAWREAAQQAASAGMVAIGAIISAVAGAVCSASRLSSSLKNSPSDTSDISDGVDVLLSFWAKCLI
jgi:hypothetical protein